MNMAAQQEMVEKMVFFPPPPFGWRGGLADAAQSEANIAFLLFFSDSFSYCYWSTWSVHQAKM